MPRTVGTGKTVPLTVRTSGIDSGESAELIVFKKKDDSQLDSLQSKVKDGLIEVDWEAKGPAETDEEQSWEVYYKAKCKGLETKAQPLTVYTDWVEVESVDEEGGVLEDAAFRLKCGEGDPRERTTGTAGKRKEEHLPPGDPVITWLKPYHLVEWIDEKGPKRKAKVKVVPPAKLVWPLQGAHDQWVNLKADAAKPEHASKLKVKVGAEGGKKGQKLYAKVTWGEKNSKRNDPKPEVVGGVTEDWCPKGGIELTLKDDDGKADGEATFDLELGLAGGDTVLLEVGGTKACDDQKVLITAWRQLYFQATRPKELALGDVSLSAATLAGAFIKYDVYKEVQLTEADGPAGSWMDGAEFGLGRKALLVGQHNRDDFKAKFDDQKTPVGAHLVLADKCYAGGPPGNFYTQSFDGVVATGSPHILTLKEKDKYDVFAKACQTGDSSVLEGTWKSKAPEGHPDCGKTGAITPAMVSINNNNARDKIKVTLTEVTPGDGVAPEGKTEKDAETKHPVELKLKVHVARGPLGGNSTGVHQIIVRYKNDKVFNAVITHELGHSLRQVCKEVAPGLSQGDHGRTYTGKGHNGSHCADGLSDESYAKDDYKGIKGASCVMYGALNGPTADPPGDGALCARCLPFFRADHAQSLKPAEANVEEETGEGDAPAVSVSITQVNGGANDHFAPGTDQLDVTYDIAGLSGEAVKLEVTSALYGRNNPIFSRDLSAEEKADGTGKTLQYDGSVTATAGALAGRRLNPLLSPYKVKLLKVGDAALVAEREFKVLYHSIELDWGTHIAAAEPPQPADVDDTAAAALTAAVKRERTCWAQLKLNQLGYDAGAVDGTATSEPFVRALRRFQRAHYKVGAPEELLPETGRADQETLKALAAAPERSRWEEGKCPLTEDCKLYVDDNFMCDRATGWSHSSAMADFNSMDRARAEQRMDRPFLPAEVKVLIKNRAGEGVDCPAAVGPVQIAWETNDAAEDDTVILTDATRKITWQTDDLDAAGDPVQTDHELPSMGYSPLSKAYVAKARQHGTSASGASRIDATGDDCHKDFGGVRETSAANTIKGWFPASTRLAPCAAPTYTTETRGPTTFHQAIVRAAADPATAGTKLGRSRVYLRPSFKGGDDIKYRAAISFAGLSNKDALVTAHEDVAEALVKETGRWTTWRRARISAWCRQVPIPERDTRGDPYTAENPFRRGTDPMDPSVIKNDPDWSNIRDGWRHAFIEIENDGIPLEPDLTYADVVTSDAYIQGFRDMAANRRPAGIQFKADGTIEGLTYRPRSVYGGTFPPPNANELGREYATRLSSLVGTWCQQGARVVAKIIRDHVRKTSPEGFIVIDFSAWDETGPEADIRRYSDERKGFSPADVRRRRDPAERTRDLERAEAEVTRTEPLVAPAQTQLDEATATQAATPTQANEDARMMAEFQRDDAVQQHTFAVQERDRIKDANDNYSEGGRLEWVAYRGWVNPDGTVLTNVHNGGHIDNYVLHECGHARYLYHHRGTDGVPAAQTATPTHHENRQECTMSYAQSPQDWTRYGVPFCGKCVLRLRGWNVATLPGAYT